MHFAKLARKVIEAEGLVVLSVRCSKHQVFRCTLPGATATRCITVPHTPSCSRSEQNMRRDIRAMKRELTQSKEV